MAKKNDPNATLETESMDLNIEVTKNATEVLSEGDSNGDGDGDSSTISTDPTAPVSKRRRLEKEVIYGDATEAGVKITVIDGNKGEMFFPLSDLPEEMVTKLAPFGLGHKLGDSAAGKSGPEAEDAIVKTFDGLKEGNWATRIAGSAVPTKKELNERVLALPENEREEVLALLAKLNIKLPGA